TGLDLLVRIDLFAVAAQGVEVRADGLGRGGDRLVGRVGLHDAAEQVEDVDQGRLPLRARLGVERVQLRGLDGAEGGPQLPINVPRRVSRRGRTPRPQVEASAR